MLYLKVLPYHLFQYFGGSVALYDLDVVYPWSYVQVRYAEHIDPWFNLYRSVQ